ncbi:MAG: hypothetical protein LBU66_02480, partial [Treponema sp.]|nr:hypothetical protein [Treponema sp.]
MIQNESFHYKRERINKLFTEAMNYPLVIVCAGSGYGKTSAVYDFAEENHGTKIWVQLSERDNVGSRFWENCANTIAPLNETFAREAIRLGFPDTPDKFKQFSTLLRAHIGIRKRILVLDDFHYIQEPSVVRFLEECVLKKMPMETSIFLLSRSSPQINIANLLPKGYIFNIDENDLRFTENELAQYFSQENITLQPESLREIMQDTEGWVFAINLIARSFQKAPGYGGYVRNAVKTNIYKMLETEVWDSVSEDLQRFMIRLSLIEHLSTDLIAQLAGNDHSLITELEKQNAYVRRDNYINAYLIHPLLLDFLSKKEELLSEKQKKETYEIAGKWCNKNGFKLDALFYFEKTGDYNAIASVLYALPAQIPRDIAKYAATILDRAPDEIFNTIENLATMHLSTYICQGLWDKSIGLAEHYEKKFLKLPKNNAFRNISLSAIYYSWGYLRILMCITDDCYDFDIYFEKFCKHFTNTLEQKKFYNHAPGPWVNAAGTSKKGSLDDFIDSLARSSAAISQCFNGIKTGDEDLARGELKFYQGDMPAAETFMIRALEQS